MNNLANTTILSNFAATGGLEVLHRLTGVLHLPTEVYDEILAGQAAGYAFYQNIEQHIYPFNPHGWLRLVTLTDEMLKLLPTLTTTLHRGEAACLVIAKIYGWGFFTDDKAARRQATAWGIKFSGTLGLLLLAVQNDLLTLPEGNRLLQQMIETAHYRSPVNDLRLLLPD